ncbi:hypothetical protein ABKN59_010687 [Abortiporus biennis]
MKLYTHEDTSHPSYDRASTRGMTKAISSKKQAPCVLPKLDTAIRHGRCPYQRLPHFISTVLANPPRGKKVTAIAHCRDKVI